MDARSNGRVPDPVAKRKVPRGMHPGDTGHSVAEQLKPQTRLVLGLLRINPDGITSLDALTNGAGFRLAARVAELRAAGYPIDSEMVLTPNGARIARYRLTDQPEQLVVGL